LYELKANLTHKRKPTQTQYFDSPHQKSAARATYSSQPYRYSPASKAARAGLATQPVAGENRGARAESRSRPSVEDSQTIDSSSTQKAQNFYMWCLKRLFTCKPERVMGGC
jgi:hypothetical protein